MLCSLLKMCSDAGGGGGGGEEGRRGGGRQDLSRVQKAECIVNLGFAWGNVCPGLGEVLEWSIGVHLGLTIGSENPNPRSKQLGCNVWRPFQCM